jgi:hypothetical protein
MQAYFCSAAKRRQTKICQMEQTKKYRGMWWLIFFIASAGLAFAIYSHWEWLTLILPFQLTAFVKAMDII